MMVRITFKYMKGKRCYFLAKSEKLCVVFGMPQAVNEADLSDEIVHLGDLSDRIKRISNDMKEREG